MSENINAIREFINNELNRMISESILPKLDSSSLSILAGRSERRYKSAAGNADPVLDQYLLTQIIRQVCLDYHHKRSFAKIDYSNISDIKSWHS